MSVVSSSQCILLPAKLINCNNFFIKSFDSVLYRIMLSGNRDYFNFSFLIWILWIAFSCLRALVRTLNALLNSSGERRCPCLVPYQSGKTPRLSPFSMILAIVFFFLIYIYISHWWCCRVMLLCQSSLRFLAWNVVVFVCLVFIKCLVCTYWNDYITFFLSCFFWCSIAHLLMCVC